jgi:ABC-type sugar transport system ATPase subunit
VDQHVTSTVQGASATLGNISKRFGATQALDRVSLHIEAGEIHALVGENGAGKSTLGKIIGGLYSQDSGQLLIDGENIHKWDPPLALATGIATIQQELSLVPARSVAENVFLGIEGSRLGVITGSELQRYEKLEAEVGFGIPPDVSVGSLRLADQQKVEILRALARNARLIVMDEPTSSLTKDETDRLHDVIAGLKREGRTLVYVSHFLDDVLEVADRVTIMRDGVITRTAPTSSETKPSLIEGMLGRTLEATFPSPPPADPDQPVVLEAREISGNVPKSISFQIRAGEIIGVAGLVGSGRTDLLRLLFGAETLREGEILLDGEALGPLTPRSAIESGIVMLPEDRRNLGLVMVQNVRENVTLPRLRNFAPRLGRILRSEETAAARVAVDQLKVVPPDLEGDIEGFSGGNQQKVLFAKWTLEIPKVILLDEPTRGVDIGAKRAIYDAILGIAAQGAAVILVSSELEEVVHLSHRVILMSDGRLIGTGDGGDLTMNEVLDQLFSAVNQEARAS